MKISLYLGIANVIFFGGGIPDKTIIIQDYVYQAAWLTSV